MMGVGPAMNSVPQSNKGQNSNNPFDMFS